MNARAAGLIAILLLALAPATAGASRKLSIAELSVPPTGQAGERLPISGTLRNAGDVLPNEEDQTHSGAGREAQFSLNPELPDAPAGDYEIAVCTRRVNKHGPTRCSTAPLTID